MPFHSFEVWFLFVFLLWENVCSLLQIFLLWHLCQGCEPELTRQAHSLRSGVSEGCSPFHSACRQTVVLGLESDFAPRQGWHRGRSRVGMLLGVCVCSPAPHTSGCIHAPAGNVQGHGARRWHSRSSNVSRAGLIPWTPPKVPVLLDVWGRHTWVGWELLTCTGSEPCPGLFLVQSCIPEPGSASVCLS